MALTWTVPFRRSIVPIQSCRSPAFLTTGGDVVAGREPFVENPYLTMALEGLNTEAVRRDIEALAAAGALRPNSNAIQTAALTCAMTLDLGANVATAAVSKELRAAMAELRCDVSGDTLVTFLASLGVALPAAVGNTSEPDKVDALSLIHI